MGAGWVLRFKNLRGLLTTKKKPLFPSKCCQRALPCWAMPCLLWVGFERKALQINLRSIPKRTKRFMFFYGIESVVHEPPDEPNPPSEKLLGTWVFNSPS